MIRLKRAYDPPSGEDGPRYLVDRLWPRGVKRESMALTGWLKEAAPSDALRKESHHDPLRWEEFRRQYFHELSEYPETWQPLLEAAQNGSITLVYAARDEQHNNAAALKEFLEQQLSDRP